MKMVFNGLKLGNLIITTRKQLEIAEITIEIKEILIALKNKFKEEKA